MASLDSLLLLPIGSDNMQTHPPTPYSIQMSLITIPLANSLHYTISIYAYLCKYAYLYKSSSKFINRRFGQFVKIFLPPSTIYTIATRIPSTINQSVLPDLKFNVTVGLWLCTP